MDKQHSKAGGSVCLTLALHSLLEVVHNGLQCSWYSTEQDVEVG